MQHLSSPLIRALSNSPFSHVGNLTARKKCAHVENLIPGSIKSGKCRGLSAAFRAEVL